MKQLFFILTITITIIILTSCIYTGSNPEYSDTVASAPNLDSLNGAATNSNTIDSTAYVPNYESTTIDNNMPQIESSAPQNVVSQSNTSISREIDFIDGIEPYARENSPWRSVTSNMFKMEICGKTYDHFIEISDDLHLGEQILFYNLEGKYTTLKFKAYCDSHREGLIIIYGNNDEVLLTQEVAGHALPIEISVDVSNVSSMKLAGKGPCDMYIFDATIQ